MKILTTNDRVYRGRKDNWTEQYTESFEIEQPLRVAHKSATRINSFEVGVITCAYCLEDSEAIFSAPAYKDAFNDLHVIQDFTEKARPDNADDFVYAMTLPAGTQIHMCGRNEYRFVMKHEVKIELIGKMGPIRIQDDSRQSRVYGGVTINVFTKRF